MQTFKYGNITDLSNDMIPKKAKSVIRKVTSDKRKQEDYIKKKSDSNFFAEHPAQYEGDSKFYHPIHDQGKPYLVNRNKVKAGKATSKFKK